MKFEEIVGIDVSKLTLDVHLHIQNEHQQFENSRQGIKQLCHWRAKQSEVSIDQCLFVFEHTGIYAYTLCVALQEKKHSYALVSGLEVKKSQGIQRGKSDSADAKMIAKYAYLHQDKIRLYELPSLALQDLKKLLNLRERMVRDRAGYKTTLKEESLFLKKKDFAEYFNLQRSTIKHLDKQIDKAEMLIDQIINADQQLHQTHLLLTSITGVGKITSANMIVLTDCFTKFFEWRKFACYAGTAPFPYESGTSIKRRSRISNLANKRIKALLDCGARAAIQHDQQIKQYYQKRLAEGKSKRSTLNIVRNKLISRMFAVVKRETPYVQVMNYA